MSVTVNLRWTPGSGGGTVTGYAIYRKTGGSAADLENDVVNDTTLKDGIDNLSDFVADGSDWTYADTGLAPATTYSYVVKAKNSTGFSAAATASDSNGGTVATVTTV
tara:strand:- start:12854 stop:13174 length:321 start_codon:yes stop_codon:yes gene_type:complete